jgi:hypothetical protein
LQSSPPSRSEGSTLDAWAILAWQRELSAALEAPSGLDDAGRINAIRALERLGCAVGPPRVAHRGQRHLGPAKAVDALVAGEADGLEAMAERVLVSAVQSETCRLDPASVVARRRRAEAERHVTLRPAPDAMTWLTALLPVKDGVAA